MSKSYKRIPFTADMPQMGEANGAMVVDGRYYSYYTAGAFDRVWAIFAYVRVSDGKVFDTSCTELHEVRNAALIARVKAAYRAAK